MSATNTAAIDTSGDNDPRWTLQKSDTEDTQLAYLDRRDFLREFEERVDDEGQLNLADTYVRAELAKLLSEKRAKAKPEPPPTPVVQLAPSTPTSNEDLIALLEASDAENQNVIAAIESRVEQLDLQAMLDAPEEPIDWTWGDGETGYVERGTVACFHGFGGLGKSMLMQAFARAVTEGSELLGLPCQRGRVLIIDAENPKREVTRRTKRLALDPASVQYLRTYDPILALGFKPWLIWRIQQWGADVVILDSQRALQGGDEKEQREMRQFYTEVREVAEATNCAIVVIHHDNKAKEFSGSADIDACVGWRWHLYANPNDDEQVFLKLAKTRGAPKLPIVNVVMNFTGMRLAVEIGDATPPRAGRGSSGSDSGERALKGDAAQIREFIAGKATRSATPKEIMDRFKMASHSTLKSRRDELAKLGVAYHEAGRLSCYHLSPAPID